MSSWVQRSVGGNTDANGTSAHTVTFTPATAGNLLIAVCAGQVVSSTPTGWTLLASSVSSDGLYVFTKTAAAGESSFTTTHNGSNFAVAAVVYEYGADWSVAGTPGSVPNASNTASNATATGLTGTYTRFAADATINVAGAGAATWTTPAIKDYEAVSGTGTANDTLLSVAYDDGATGTSFTAARTTTGGSGAHEVIAWALVSANNISGQAGAAHAVTATTSAVGAVQFSASATTTVTATTAAHNAPPVTHGRDLIGGETTKVGYTAYFDTTLGRNLTADDLTRHTGAHFLSDFTGGVGGTADNPVVLYALDLDEVIWDVDYVTLRACRIRIDASAYRNGVHHLGAALEWCTFDSTASNGTQCIQYESYSLYRCLLQGQTDGAKVNGGTLPITVTECIIKTLQQDAGDHNDCAQNVGGAGTVYIERCLMYMDPIGAPGQGDSAILSADFAPTGDPFHLEAIDNYVVCSSNGNGAFRFYDGAVRSNITYKATGNVFDLTANPYSYYLDRGLRNTTPEEQIEWSGNSDQNGVVLPFDGGGPPPKIHGFSFVNALTSASGSSVVPGAVIGIDNLVTITLAAGTVTDPSLGPAAAAAGAGATATAATTAGGYVTAGQASDQVRDINLGVTVGKDRWAVKTTGAP